MIFSPTSLPPFGALDNKYQQQANDEYHHHQLRIHDLPPDHLTVSVPMPNTNVGLLLAWVRPLTIYTNQNDYPMAMAETIGTSGIIVHSHS